MTAATSERERIFYGEQNPGLGMDAASSLCAVNAYSECGLSVTRQFEEIWARIVSLSSEEPPQVGQNGGYSYRS